MNAHIGDRIREARQARGMSLRQLAGRVGIHYSHLSKVENGKDSVGRQTLVRIAEELGADPELMLGEAGLALSAVYGGFQGEAYDITTRRMILVARKAAIL